MAISGEALGRLVGSNYDPYIHSNIYNLFSMIRLTNKGETEASQELDNAIQLYTKYISELKTYEQELYTFCHVNDYQELNQKLFGTNSQHDNYYQLAYSVLRDPTFIRSIIPEINKEVAAQAFTALNANSRDYIDEIFATNDTISIADFMKAFREAIGKSLPQDVIIVSTHSEKFRSLFSSDFQQNIEQYVSDMAISKLKIKVGDSGGSKSLRQLSKKILIDKIGSSLIIDEQVFINNFIQRFKAIAIRHQHPILHQQDYNQLVRDTAQDVYNVVVKGNHFLPFMKNLLGDIAEYGMNYVVQKYNNQVNIDIGFDHVGNKTEAELSKYLATMNIDNALMSFHDINTQSQTDMILNITSNGQTKIFRVQSKNSLLDFIDEYDEAVSRNRPMIIKAQDSTSMKNLLNKLKDNHYLTDAETQAIAYFLANATWFYTAGSISPNNKGYDPRTRTSKQNQGKGGAGITGIMYMVERILSIGIGAFIGLTIAQGAEQVPSSVNFNASNIFYFLGNRTLFPVSEILKSAVTIMKETQQRLLPSRLHLVADMKDISYGYSDALSLYKSKQNIPGGLQAGRNYQDAALLQIGQSQGKNIMDMLTGHVNIDFQIIDILMSSSYLFDIKE